MNKFEGSQINGSQSKPDSHIPEADDVESIKALINSHLIAPQADVISTDYDAAKNRTDEFRTLPLLHSDILNYIYQTRGIPTFEIGRELAKYSPNYLSWNTVRKNNPFIADGTGAEGYFVGSCTNGEEVIHKIAQVGIDMRQHIIALHGRGTGNQLIKDIHATMEGKTFKPKAIIEAQTEFAAEIFGLRPLLHHNPQGQDYQQGTLNIIQNLPPIYYLVSGDKPNEAAYNGQFYQQAYCLPKNGRSFANLKTTKFSGDPLMILNDEEKEGYALFDRAARTGNPFLRVLTGLIKP
jgi:hypothetical protein